MKTTTKQTKKLSPQTKKNLMISAEFFSFLFSTIFLLSSLLFFSYCIALTVATSSVMVFFTSFGISIFPLAFSCFLFIYGKKIYNQLKNKNSKIENTSPHEKKPQKSIFEIVAYSILGLATLSILVSACLGSTEKTKWQVATMNFVAENGYYTEDKNQILHFDNIETINIETKDKTVFVVYNDVPFFQIQYVNKFNNQIAITQIQKSLTIKENTSPKKNEALDNMLFFIFSENERSKQIILTIPTNLKGSVTISGNKIIYTK